MAFTATQAHLPWFARFASYKDQMLTQTPSASKLVAGNVFTPSL
jgi:hypothetical protein